LRLHIEKKENHQMRKFLSVAGLLVLALALVGTASAGKVGFAKTWVYDPGNTSGAVAEWTKEGLSLRKTAETSVEVAAGVEIKGVEGETLTQLSFEVKGYCGAGAPRFNVYTESTTYFIGCIYGKTTNLADGWQRVTFSGDEIGGVGAFDSVMKGIDIVQDEEGATLLRNISVNDVVINKFPNS
jgi:hypothetical protein